jgi:hypothetical protein
VTPLGEVVAVPERGTLMGNRGVLHDDAGNLVRPWRTTNWLICLLEFRGRRRTVMAPGRYTELFFLDEATALAAGHRPCFECRRERFHAFLRAWLAGNPGLVTSATPRIAEVDRHLHAERTGAGRAAAAAVPVAIDELPDGVFVRLPDRADTPYLLWRGSLMAWSAGGYRERLARPRTADVIPLTPPSITRAIAAGYTPAVHGSAFLSRGEPARACRASPG